jgi:hypothetical protein
LHETQRLHSLQWAFGHPAPPALFIRKDVICQVQNHRGRADSATMSTIQPPRDSRCLKGQATVENTTSNGRLQARRAGSPCGADSPTRVRSKTARAKRPAKSTSETASATLWLANTVKSVTPSKQSGCLDNRAIRHGRWREKQSAEHGRQTGAHPVAAPAAEKVRVSGGRSNHALVLFLLVPASQRIARGWLACCRCHSGSVTLLPARKAERQLARHAGEPFSLSNCGSQHVVVMDLMAV